MSKRFIVLLQSETDQQTKAFGKLLSPTDEFIWWHWLPNSWLIVDINGKFTALTLNDEVKKIYPNTNNFVTEIVDDVWAAFGPGGESTYFKWLHKHWA